MTKFVGIVFSLPPREGLDPARWTYPIHCDSWAVTYEKGRLWLRVSNIHVIVLLAKRMQHPDRQTHDNRQTLHSPHHQKPQRVEYQELERSATCFMCGLGGIGIP